MSRLLFKSWRYYKRLLGVRPNLLQRWIFKSELLVLGMRSIQFAATTTDYADIRRDESARDHGILV
jgi:hypothetical protein